MFTLHRVSLCFLLPLALVAGVIDYSVSVNPADVRTEAKEGYDYVSVRGFDHISRPGYPVLPAQTLTFVIPPDAQFERLEVLNEQGDDIPGEFLVFPGQKPMPLSIEHVPEFTPPDSSIYSLDELYPSTPVQFVHEGNLSGYRLVAVSVAPLRYCPSSRRMYISHHLAFRIHYRSGARKLQSVSENRRKNAAERVRSLVINTHDVGGFSPPARAGTSTGEYVIITDTSFVNAFEPLRKWKMKKGVPTKIVTTSWIYANYSGVDNPDKIRNYIKAAADSGALYVLLAGQCDWEHSENFVPRRDAFVFEYDGPFPNPDEDTIPCDMYYANLDGTWDADGDGTYGEMTDSVDLYSDIFVGRAPVKDGMQIENFVSKVITYETSPALSYIEKILLPVGNLFEGNHGNGCNDTIADTIPDHWQKSKLYEDYGLMSRYIVRDSINQGFQFCNMVGHGNYRGIYYDYGNSRYYYDTDVLEQTNDSTKTVIALSNSCLNAALDWGNSYSNYDCLAERMVNANKGCAVATIMNTRYGWGNAYIEGKIEYSDEYCVWFYRKLFGASAYHLAEALASAKDQLAYKSSPDYPGDKYTYRWCHYTLTLSGDPEMPLWTTSPDTLLVTHPPVVDTGSCTFTVKVNDGNGLPLQDALVCCYISTQTPEMQVMGYTDASGTAVLSVKPKNHGNTMYVTVSKHNFVPYQGSAKVHARGPYIAMGKMIVVEPNKNGQVNPGEIIDLGIWAKNWGKATANNVYGNLSESDPYATINVFQSRYGKIAVRDSVLSKPYYRFTVAGNCPNKHTIAFNLEFKDSYDSVWTSHPKIIVYAPVLTFENARVANDNNVDGVLGPGEVANIIVKLKNEGDAVANYVTSMLMTSSPYITINDAFGSFGTINPGAVAENVNDPYKVTVSSSTPYNTEIGFSIIIQSGVYKDTLDFTLITHPPHLVFQNAGVVNDNNHNNHLEPGETADVVVALSNDGLATADNVMSTLRTSSPYITINDSSGTFGSIASGDTADNELNPFRITADSATPYFDTIAFTIPTQAGFYKDTFDFTVTVYVPVLTLQDVRVVNDDDGDGAIEPGECADVMLTVKNEGEVEAANVTSLLRATSPYITLLDSIGSYDIVGPGDTSSNSSDYFTVMADSATPYFAEVALAGLFDAGVYHDTSDFTMNIGEFPATDTGYYYAFYSGGPHIQSPVFEWIAIDTTQTQYPGKRTNISSDGIKYHALTLPFSFYYYGKKYGAITVGLYGHITMRRGYANDSTNSPIPDPDGQPRMIAPLWDYLKATNQWPQPSDIYYYSDTLNHRFIVEYFNIEHEPGGDPETFEVILYDPAYYPTPTGDGEIVVQYLNAPKQTDITIGIEDSTQTVGIQYYYEGVYHPKAGEITDSFAIRYTTYPKWTSLQQKQYGMQFNGCMQADEMPVSAVPTQTLLQAPYPNPFTSRIQMQYQLATATRVHLQVYDVVGRLVRTLVNGKCNPGYYTQVWNGYDEQGRKVPAGIYFVRFETDTYTKIEKTILVR